MQKNKKTIITYALTIGAVIGTMALGYATAPDINTIGKTFLNLILSAVRIAGVFMFVFAAVNIVMAIINDNPEKQKSAAGQLVVSVFMISLKSIAIKLGVYNWLTIDTTALPTNIIPDTDQIFACVQNGFFCVIDASQAVISQITPLIDIVISNMNF